MTIVYSNVRKYTSLSSSAASAVAHNLYRSNHKAHASFNREVLCRSIIMKRASQGAEHLQNKNNNQTNLRLFLSVLFCILVYRLACFLRNIVHRLSATVTTKTNNDEHFFFVKNNKTETITTYKYAKCAHIQVVAEIKTAVDNRAQ